MNRATHPFRSSRTRSSRPVRSTRAVAPRDVFALDLATWFGRLAPANGPLPAEALGSLQPLPAVDTPAEVIPAPERRAA